MKRGVLVLLMVGLPLLGTGGGRPLPAQRVYSVLEVLLDVPRQPRLWVGHTLLVRGVALRAPEVGLMLVDTRLVASLQQEGLTPDEAATQVLAGSVFLSPVPILFLRSQHTSRYGHDLIPRVYRILLHPIPCTKKSFCKAGDLLGP